VSVYSFESSTKGIIAQIKGNLMKDRHTAAMVYLDHFSGLSFVYMQRDQSSAELMKSKVAFESFSKSHGVEVYNYHADNGSFADNAFINDVKGQTRHLILQCQHTPPKWQSRKKHQRPTRPHQNTNYAGYAQMA